MDDTTQLRADGGAAGPARPPRLVRTLAEDAYAVLKQAIVRCELAPGQHISESYLVGQFGLGRSAIRTALSRLVQEDLVRSVARKGHIIAPITFRRVKEVFDVRTQLEPLAAERAAMSSRDLSYLQVLDEQCKSATYRPGDRDAVDRFLRANTRLHVEIVAAGGNQFMADLITDLLHESERFFHLALWVTDRNDEMYHEHHELIEALLTADGARARALAADAIRTSETMVTGALMASPALLEANISTLTG